MSKIIQNGDKVLRMEAESVDPKMFGSKKLLAILKDMAKTANAEQDAVAIAAPQIGVSLRIFVITDRVREIIKSPDLPLIYINPTIIKQSKDKKAMEEGCLSVRWLYGKVRRSSRVTIEAFDESGNKFTRGASGLLAQIFQHETDHLDGILFIDTAKNLREMLPENQD